MKKTERINTLMRYINNRAQFTISEIMEEFNISRSTAIRDIREIEAMGLPLVAEVGRTGGYSVMKNAVLPAVQFTDDEIKALFVAFLATKNQQLPFLKSRLTLTEKLIGLLSIVQQDDLVLLNEILLFQGTNPENPDLLDMLDISHPVFEKLIQMFLIDRYLQLTIKEGNQTSIYPVYLLHLYQENNGWFVECFDLNIFQKRIFAISQLEDVSVYDALNAPSEMQIIKILNDDEPTHNVELVLGPKAMNQFRKYHPIKAKIFYTNPFQLSGICRFNIDTSSTEDIEEAVHWLLFLGNDIEIQKMPKEVKAYIKSTHLLSKISQRLI